MTGLPVAALVVPASSRENQVSELVLAHLDRQGVTERIEVVLVDRGATAASHGSRVRAHACSARTGVESSA